MTPAAVAGPVPALIKDIVTMVLRSLSYADVGSLVEYLKKEPVNPQTLKFLHEIQGLGPTVFEERSWFSDSNNWDGENRLLCCLLIRF